MRRGGVAFGQLVERLGFAAGPVVRLSRCLGRLATLWRMLWNSTGKDSNARESQDPDAVGVAVSAGVDANGMVEAGKCMAESTLVWRRVDTMALT